MYPVYLITCTHPRYGQHIKGYVGCCPSGKPIARRFSEHLRGIGSAKHLRSAIRKYGREWFTVEQIDSGNTPEQAFELEQWWIKRLDTFGSGYNQTAGGEGTVGVKHPELIARGIARRGIPLPESTKQKMGEAYATHPTDCQCASHRTQRGEAIKRIAPPSWEGKTHTQSTRLKMSLSAKGRVFSESTRLKMSNAAKERCQRQRNELGRYTTND